MTEASFLNIPEDTQTEKVTQKGLASGIRQTVRRAMTPATPMANDVMRQVREAAEKFVSPGSSDLIEKHLERISRLEASQTHAIDAFITDGKVVKKCFLYTGVQASDPYRFLYLSLEGLDEETARKALRVIATTSLENRIAALQSILPKYVLFFDLRPDQALSLVTIFK